MDIFYGYARIPRVTGMYNEQQPLFIVWIRFNIYAEQ